MKTFITREYESVEILFRGSENISSFTTMRGRAKPWGEILLKEVYRLTAPKNGLDKR